MPGQREGDVEEEDRRVEDRRVDDEPDDGDETEEAVEDEQEEGDGEQADERRDLRLFERVLPERRRDRRLVERTELDRERTRLQDERQVLRLAHVGETRDLRAVRARDAARVLLEVDRRPRLDLAVEHDREVLEEVAVVALAAADRVEEEPPALRDVARDLLERVRAVVGEVHQDDRLARRRVEVLPRALEIQVLTGHLRDVGRREAEEVVRVRRRLELGHARAHDLAGATLDDDRLGRHGEELVTLRAARRPTSRAPPRRVATGPRTSFLPFCRKT